MVSLGSGIYLVDGVGKLGIWGILESTTAANKRTNKLTPINQNNPPHSETAATTAARDILLNIASGADIPYGPNATPNPTTHFSAAASGFIVCVGVTQLLALRPMT